MNTKVLLTATILSVFFIGSIGAASVASAQYLGNVGSEGETGQSTLEEALKLQSDRVANAEANPGAGSGTPYLDANGVVGAGLLLIVAFCPLGLPALVIAGAVFGGIAGAFFIRGRSGKYAAMGRG